MPKEATEAHLFPKKVWFSIFSVGRNIGSIEELTLKATTLGPHKFYVHCYISPCRSTLLACSIAKVSIYKGNSNNVGKTDEAP